MKEEILDTIVEKINDLPEILCNVIEYEVYKSDRIIDAVIQLQVQDQKLVLNVEVKSKIVPAQIPKIMQLHNEIESIMVAAHYITPKAQNILIKGKIPYVDTAGNIFIIAKGIYIMIQTENSHRGILDQSNRAFTKAGLKVVYQFLLNPEYINDPYRKIGSQSKVTIDTVGKVIKGLLSERFILQADNKNYKLLDKEKLLQKWVTEYNQTLRPKLKKRKFRWVKKNKEWRNFNLPPDTYWGGAAAAEKLTNYLIADNLVIYTGIDFVEVAKELEVVPDKQGKIELIEKFWNQTIEEEIVNPILVYADLIADQNPRYIETANKIYHEYIENQI